MFIRLVGIQNGSSKDFLFTTGRIEPLAMVDEPLAMLLREFFAFLVDKMSELGAVSENLLLLQSCVHHIEQ